MKTAIRGWKTTGSRTRARPELSQTGRTKSCSGANCYHYCHSDSTISVSDPGPGVVLKPLKNIKHVCAVFPEAKLLWQGANNKVDPRNLVLLQLKWSSKAGRARCQQHQGHGFDIQSLWPHLCLIIYPCSSAGRAKHVQLQGHGFDTQVAHVLGKKSTEQEHLHTKLNSPFPLWALASCPETPLLCEHRGEGFITALFLLSSSTPDSSICFADFGPIRALGSQLTSDQVTGNGDG